jgi:hypothetical protein
VEGIWGGVGWWMCMVCGTGVGGCLNESSSIYNDGHEGGEY